MGSDVSAGSDVKNESHFFQYTAAAYFLFVVRRRD
jgi:hypothetical protein